MADLDYYGADYGAEEPSRFLDAVRDFGFANWAGAITSVGLTAGLAVWAVDMTLRDVSGVPVIAALEGPMREAPANPGGTVAPFQGLALSDITSGGSAAPAPEQIVLAPPAVLLDAPALSERMAVAMQVEETEAEVAIVEAPVVAEVEVMSMQDAVRLALAEAVGDGSLPADGQPASALVDPTAMPASTEPGLARSMRPRSRPQRLSRIAAMAPATLPTEAPTQQPGTQVASLGVISLPMRDAVDLAPGTRVAQLGDFESEVRRPRRMGPDGVCVPRPDAGQAAAGGEGDLGRARLLAPARRRVPRRHRSPPLLLPTAGARRDLHPRHHPLNDVPGAFILGCEGPDLSAREAAFFRDTDPWGFILFARNVDTPDRLRRLTAALRDAVGRDAPVLIDQEGGRVQRLGPPAWPAWPDPLDQMRQVTDPERAMFLRAALIAFDLRDVGIDVNCTPTADIASSDTHPFLRSRLYGEDVETVVARARANADGCLRGGVLPVIKHIPGHGRGTVDSHLGLPVVDTPLDALRASDFEVFRQLRDLPLGMSAHVVYSAIDSEPGTISAPVIAEVRGTIGFDGLLMTDDISMGALPGGLLERARGALSAGCDVVLHCNGEMDEMERLAAALPSLNAAGTRRANRALAMRREPPALDIEAARAELASLAV